jgi:hypothetical protein
VEIGLQPGGGAVIAWQRYRGEREGRPQWTLDVVRLDARGRERDRRRDVLSGRNTGGSQQSILVDAIGTAWIAMGAEQVAATPSGHRPRRLWIVQVPPDRRRGVLAFDPGVVEQAEDVGRTALVECGGAVWVVASIYGTRTERVIARRATGDGDEIELMRRTETDPRLSHVRHPTERIEAGCDGERGVALLTSFRPEAHGTPRVWPSRHAAWVSWSAR